jgi:signal peptidase II
VSSNPPAEPVIAAESAPPTRRIGTFVAVAVLALGLDLLSKCLVVANIAPTDDKRLLGGALYLVQTRNSGAAFSVGTGATVALTIVAVVVAVVIARAARRLRSAGWAIALGLVLGGALGNLIDRFFRAPSPGKGHVVDWITVFPNDHWTFPTFNLADSAIVIGGCLAVLLSLLGIDLQGHRAGRQGHA